MGSFFNIDSGIMGFMSKVADMIILSLLWFLCSLPIITIGASTTALYYTAVKSIRRERGYIIRSFFSSFKENFIPGTLLWILFLAIMAVLGVNIRFSQQLMGMEGSKTMGFVLMAAYCLFGIIAAFSLLYVFPVLSRFVLNKRQILKMSLFMSIRHLPYTFLLLLILAVTLFGMFYIPMVIFIGPAAGAMLYSFIMERILKQYIKQEEQDGHKDEWYLE